MKKIIVLIIASLVATGCLQTRNQVMQVKKEDNAYAELEGSIDELKQKLNDMNESVNTLSAKVDSTTASLEELRKRETEIVKEEVAEVKEIFKAPEKEIVEEAIDGNIEKMEVATPKILPLKEFYKKALGLFYNKEYSKAIAEFDSFGEAYPETDYSDNAIYWKGEGRYALSEFRAAIKEFENVVKSFSDGDKAPDAQLMIGNSYAALKDRKMAKGAFLKVLAKYPSSRAAKKATRKLKSM